MRERMNYEDALAEVDSCIQQFKSELGQSPRHFSFPYSRVVPEITRYLAESGLQSVMTTDRVEVHTSLNPLDLRRIEATRSNNLLRYRTSGAHPGLSYRLFRRI